MFIDIENILLIGSILLLISVVAGKTTNRLGVPTLIFFLIVGVLAGSEGIGGIHFDNASIAQLIGITALNFILFSGGLDTNWQSIGMLLASNIPYPKPKQKAAPIILKSEWPKPISNKAGMVNAMPMALV